MSQVYEDFYHQEKTTQVSVLRDNFSLSLLTDRLTVSEIFNTINVNDNYSCGNVMRRLTASSQPLDEITSSHIFPKKNLMVVRKKSFGCPEKMLWSSEKIL